MNAVSAFAEKLKSVIAEFGVAKGLLYLLDRMLRGVGGGLYVYHFVAQPVTAASLMLPGRGRSIAVREVNVDNPALAAMPLDDKVLRYRAAQQAICLGAFAGEQMIGCLWLCLGPYNEDEVRGRFVPDPPDRCSWDFDVYLKPEFRLGFGFAKLWEEANRFLSGRGIGWSMSRISALNLHSIASHRRLGLRHLGSAIFLRFRRVQLALSSIRPHVHLSLSDASVPEFVLRAPDR